MEPSRQTVLCDPVTAARGSFAALDGQRKTLLSWGVTPGDLGGSRHSITPDGSSDRARAPSSNRVAQHCGVRFDQARGLEQRRADAVACSTDEVNHRVGRSRASSVLSRFGHDAPLWRVIRGLAVSRAFGRRSAPATDRLTSGCTRRRRATQCSQAARGEPG